MKYKLLLLIVLISISFFGQNITTNQGFIENKGQIIDQKGRANNAVKYLLNTSGLNVQLRKNGFSYDVYETKKHPNTQKPQKKLLHYAFVERDTLKNSNYSLEHIYHRIDIDFENSNSNVKLISEEKSTDFDNYYNIPNVPNGITDVHKFQKVTYQNIYPNIDVVFTIPEDKQKAVEYNFIVHPKGKISDIQLKFNGVKTEKVDNKIKMKVRFGQLEEIIPLSWTEEGTYKNEIAINYKQLKKNVFGFESLQNVMGKKVIIDPVPNRLWGTYYGGEGEENNFNGIVKTNNQFVYIGGYTTSLTNISTSGSHQSNLTLSEDAFIAKFDSEGQRVWSTYYGGANSDIFTAIDFDSNNNIYGVGYTGSTNNIATPGTHQTIYKDWYDGMIIKLDTNGQRIWGTYYGGDGIEALISLKIDNDQNILVTGYSHSNNGITTPNGFKPTVSTGTNLAQYSILAKFSPSGQIIWGTYYGNGYITSVDVDSNNNIFCLGTTDSFTEIATSGAYHENYNYNNSITWYDSFIVKFNTNGERIFGTYYGGTDYDNSNTIKIDKEDNFIITGHTRSIDDIGNSNSFQPDNGGNWDSYLAKFTNNGNLIWSTFYGGDGYDGMWGRNSIDIDEENSIYFLSSGTSSNNISTTGAYQENLPGTTNLYIAKFKPTGEREWGTYYGGSIGDYSGDISYDKNGAFYISGWTYSNNGIATPNAFQNQINGTYDTFLIKFKDCESSTLLSSNSPICIGNSVLLMASGGTTYAWTGPNGFTSTDQNPTIQNANIINSGQYSCIITGTSDCDNTITVDVIVGDNLKPIPDVLNLPTITGNCTTIISTIPTATDNCAGIVNGTTVDPLSFSLPGNYTITWNYNDENGNTESQTQSVVITAVVLPTTTSTTQTFCIQESATINSIIISGQNIKWYDAQTAGNLIPNTSALQNGTTYYASQTINVCESLRIPVLVNIQSTSIPTGNATQSFCATQNATLYDIDVSGTDLKWYASKTITTPLATSTLLVDGTKYFVTQTINGCESVDRFEVTVSLISTLNANNYSEMLCDDLNDGSENITLSDYNSNLIPSSTDVIFTYYSSDLGAENENSSDKINSNYKLTLGLHKIYVRIDSNNGCHQIVTLTLTLVAKPNITINDILSICEGKPISVSAGIGADSYLWSTGATSQSTVINAAGDYSVTATKNYGSISCSLTKNFSVKNSQTATIKNIEIKDWTTNDNQIIVYTNETGDFEYSINGTNFQDSNQFSNLPTGDYTVTVRDKYGCSSSTEEVYLLMFPKFFTPNGDLYNPTWSIQNSEKENLVTKIFDRYGKVIIILQHNQSWDGTLNGKNLPSTDYWFTVTRPNGKEYKGHFSLKR